jgi:hypothetical protein
MHARRPSATRAAREGVLVDAPAFPGWASFAAFSAHVTFVNMHHHQIERLALVSGAPLLRTAATAASALLSPEVRLVNDGETMKALDWLTEGTPDRS